MARTQWFIEISESNSVKLTTVCSILVFNYYCLIVVVVHRVYALTLVHAMILL